MTSTASGQPPTSMQDIHARLSRIMALIQQLTDESLSASGSIAAQRSGEDTGGDVE